MNKRGKGSYCYIEQSERWRWRGYYTDPVTKKREPKVIYARSRKELRAKVEEWLLAVEGGEYAKEITFASWFEIWMNTVIADSVKIRTREIYRYILAKHVIPVFGQTKISGFDAKAYQDFLNERSKKYSASTVSTIRRYTIMCLDAAVRYGYINRQPLRNTRPPRKEHKEIIALDKSQTDAIIATAKEGNYQQQPRDDAGADYLRKCYYAMIVTAVDTGMRQGELLGLRWEDINLVEDSQQHIIVRNNLITAHEGTMLDTPKTFTSARKILIGKRCIGILRWWHEEQKAYADKYKGLYNNSGKMVFTSSTGNYVSVTNFDRRCFRAICNKVGLGKDVTFHALRHSHASQLLAAGVPPQVVSQRLGHSDLNVTLRVYAHLLPTMQELAMDKVNLVFGGGESAT